MLIDAEGLQQMRAFCIVYRTFVYGVPALRGCPLTGLFILISS